MPPITILLWALVLFIGIPMALVSLSLYIFNRNLRDLDALESTGFLQLAFEQFPWHVRRLLGQHRREALENGFTELAVFTRTGLGSPNFSCIMISPDRISFAEIEYVRVAPFFLLLFLFFSPRDFFRSLFGLHGMVLSTVFSDNYRLSTTGLKFLASQEANDKEYQVLPRSSSLKVKLHAHNERIGQISVKRNTTPTRFASTEEYLEFERRIMRQLAEQGRKEIEKAQSECTL